MLAPFISKMPQHRIKLAHTIEFKIKTVEDFLSSSETRVSFCEGRAFSRPALQYWEHHLDEMKLSVQDRKRAKKLTVGGSGRVSPSACVEDELCGWIKDERREERPVSIDCIIAQCASLLPGFIDGKTDSARRSWCAKFMRRNGLTIRRISHSGREKHPKLLALRDAFACEVTTVLMDYFLDAASSTPPSYVLYNMAQTAIYCDVGAKTTVDFVGVTRVPANGGGKGSYRCTAALLACADGRMLSPHFVSAGEPDNDVQDEVNRYCEPWVATILVQKKAWFDERVMLEWVDLVWQYEVSGPSVLILDCLKVHKCNAVRQRLAEMGTYTLYVPAGCTSVAQPLDVGVMAPFKSSLRARYTEQYTNRPPPRKAHERRYDMFQRSMHALRAVTSETIRNSFLKAGPFIPFGPSSSSSSVVAATEVVV